MVFASKNLYFSVLDFVIFLGFSFTALTFFASDELFISLCALTGELLVEALTGELLVEALTGELLVEDYF
jgi:hypothetical protein